MVAVACLRGVRLPATLLTAWVSLFFIGTDLFVVSPLLPLIARDYGVPPSLAGLSVTAFALSYMVAAPFLGHLADRIGRRPVLTGCLFAFGAANLLSAAAGTLPALATARLLAGAAAAGVTPSIYALIGDCAPPRQRGTWLAVAVSGLLMSLSLGAPMGALMGARFGWPAVFAGFALLSIPLLWLNLRVWPAFSSRPAGEAAQPEPAFGAAAQRLLLTMLWSTALYGMYTYLGTGLDGAGFDTARIAETIFLYGAGAVVGNLLGGLLADRFGSRTVVATSLAGIIVGFIALRLAIMGVLPIGATLAVASALAQLFFPAQQAGLAADFPRRRATLLAWNNAALFFGISLGSLVGGQAVTLGGFSADLVVSAAIALTAWLTHAILGAAVAPAAETVEERAI
jgi:predicted MFS family arabinose efflux permease